MDGSAVDGPASLRDALVKPGDLRPTMTEKLMVYALGEVSTRRTCLRSAQSMRTAARDNYRFSALVIGIVSSVPFQLKTIAPIDGGASAVAMSIQRDCSMPGLVNIFVDASRSRG